MLVDCYVLLFFRKYSSFKYNFFYLCGILLGSYFYLLYIKFLCIYSLLRRKVDFVYSEFLNISGLSWRLKVYLVSIRICI